MSWRIVFEPACEGNTDWAECVVPADATDEQVDRAADKWAWSLPMKVYVKSVEDPRYIRFTARLMEEHSMGEDDWTVFVR